VLVLVSLGAGHVLTTAILHKIHHGVAVHVTTTVQTGCPGMHAVGMVHPIIDVPRTGGVG